MGRANSNLVFLLAVVFLGTILITASAETITLKSGDCITGKIVERTAQEIKVQTKELAFPLVYSLDEIKEIKADEPSKVSSAISVSPVATTEFSAYLEEAKRRFVNRDYPGALTNLLGALELQPNMPELYSEKGALYYYLKDYNQAVDAFKASLKLKDDNFAIYLCLAICYKELGDIQSAKNVMLGYYEHFDRPSNLLAAETVVKYISE